MTNNNKKSTDYPGFLKQSYEIPGAPDSEAKATTAFLYLLRNEYVSSGRLYKFTDASMGSKPFDIFAIIKGYCIGIEVKYISLKRVVDVEKTVRGMLEPHQMLNLQKIENAGGCGYIGAYVVAESKFYLIPFTHGKAKE